MKETKLYMVAVDTYEDQYGTNVELLGIYLAKETAEDKVRQLKLGGYPYAGIREVEVSKTYSIGYESGDHVLLAQYFE